MAEFTVLGPSAADGSAVKGLIAHRPSLHSAGRRDKGRNWPRGQRTRRCSSSQRSLRPLRCNFPMALKMKKSPLIPLECALTRKCVAKSFGMHSYKCKGLKLPSNDILPKNRGGGEATSAVENVENLATNSSPGSPGSRAPHSCRLCGQGWDSFSAGVAPDCLSSASGHRCLHFRPLVRKCRVFVSKKQITVAGANCQMLGTIVSRVVDASAHGCYKISSLSNARRSAARRGEPLFRRDNPSGRHFFPEASDGDSSPTR